MSLDVNINSHTIHRDHALLNKYLSQKTLHVNVPKLNLFMILKEIQCQLVLFADFCEANRRQLSVISARFLITERPLIGPAGLIDRVSHDPNLNFAKA